VDGIASSHSTAIAAPVRATVLFPGNSIEDVLLIGDDAAHFNRIKHHLGDETVTMIAISDQGWARRDRMGWGGGRTPRAGQESIGVNARGSRRFRADGRHRAGPRRRNVHDVDPRRPAPGPGADGPRLVAAAGLMTGSDQWISARRND
jgi:hypothetical protein